MSYSEYQFRKYLLEAINRVADEIEALREVESLKIMPKRYYAHDLIQNCMTCKHNNDCHKVLDCESSNFKHWESTDEEPKTGRYPWGVKTVPLNDTKGVGENESSRID